MTPRLTGLEIKSLLLVALIGLLFAGTWYDTAGNRGRSEHQTATRILHLGELIAASTAAQQGAPAGARRLEAVGAAEASLIRMRDAVKLLSADYQFDESAFLRLSVIDEAIVTRLADLRRGGDAQASFDPALGARLAVELLGREQQRLDNSATSGDGVRGAMRWLQPLLFGLALIIALLLLRDARKWRLRAVKPDATTYMQPGQTIADRRALMSGIQASIVSSLNRSRTIGLMHLQLANATTLRDRLGWESADRMVGEFADRLRSEFRRSDIIARLEGDALVVMASDISSRSDLTGFEQRIRRVLEELNKTAEAGAALNIEVGAAMYPIDGYSAEDMLTAARASVARSKTIDGQISGAPQLTAKPA
ncbi:response regulator PleD [Variibacter gotjawalensis]|uniref:Response regulator PleD n=1 Tax=Variibacter gotjawalensis TaxID=1333996 RepID=A0A0S3PUK4_9BRAD|nr:diguanylate cyclase [Variibacter gotjawalensis]NIK49923.1 diguanylate cyclase (GGDEF)-like protein [Variibacter gotjawalensis]RZS45922.1 diguanylate cyclase (GGDEF)-like protein [Variibacter gotjawalensis]BAT59597.1 response regulator PleD [Variibacter gotjawalensis]